MKNLNFIWKFPLFSTDLKNDKYENICFFLFIKLENMKWNALIWSLIIIVISFVHVKCTIIFENSLDFHWLMTREFSWICRRHGGYSPENGKWVCAALKTPFSRPPGCSLRPLFHNFSVPQGPIFAWNHKFFENLHFKASKLGKFQFLSIKFDQISVPRASNLTKNQFFKTSNLATVRSLSP